VTAETWTYHSRASTRHKYLTVATPKVGCTTIKRTLHAFEGLPPAEPWWNVHETGDELRLAHFAEADQRTLLTSPDVLRFAFVRNPYDRMLSAWKSKILRNDDQYERLQASVRAAYSYPPATTVSFGDLVRHVATDGPFDAHWERQVDVLAWGRITYDEIGRFENFAADFNAILTRLDAPSDVLELAAQVTNPTSELPMAAAYDSELAAIVYDYYRDDFETFGYARDSWYQPVT
jgi:hypothetical protein